VLLAFCGCGGTGVRVATDVPATPDAPRVEPAGRLAPPDGNSRFTPAVMGIDAKGRILVSDESRGTMFAWAQGGATPIGWLASPPGARNRFGLLRAIATSGGLNIWALDADDGRIYQYDLAYEVKATVFDATRLEGRFGTVRITALAFDQGGQPIVADEAGDRLIVLDPHWSPRFEIGAPGAGRGAFRDPTALAVGPDGRIWVADRGNGIVQVLSPLGAFVTEYAMANPPESLAIDAAGDVAVGDAAGAVTLMGASGWRRTLPAPAGSRGAAYVAWTADGKRLYVARPVAGTVEMYEVMPTATTP